MAKVSLIILFVFSGIAFTFAQTDDGLLRLNEFRNPVKRNIITIPDVDGYLTLKCDFHMHTVFSDGHVWPNVRVQEAWQEGLDVISITDHIEYLPHAADVKVDHNRSWELAKERAAQNNILMIKGSEITRGTPPGHFNAIFNDDASGYIEERGSELDMEAVKKADEQDAFIFWNHPGWKASSVEGSYEWIDFVDELTKKNMLHGIEVINGFTIHKKALDWCIDNDLTVMGTSDVHNLIVHDYAPGEYIHRSMTLVFAEKRTPEAVREALEAGRTVAWASKYLAGKEEHVKKLFHSCVKISPAYYSRGERNYYEIRNQSDLYFELQLLSGEGTNSVTLYPGSSQIISAPSELKNLKYEVNTAFVRSDKHLVVEIPLKE